MLLSSSDLSEYGALPAAVRAEVDAWVREFEGASRPLTKAFADIAGRMSCDATTVRRKFYAWTKSGQDFRSLINRAKIPERRNLPAEFIEFWRSLCERNQRKCKPAHRALVAAWRSGAAIPGYEGTDQPRHEIPAGWDYSNLMRYRPTKFELATMRQGTAFAKAHAPQVFSTRVGLWPGSHYMFDDVWHDNKVMFRGKPVRAVEIGALDVFSGMRVSWGTKPRFEREDGTMDSVNEALMRFMLAGLLWQHGYDPERGTVLMAEHGSAAIRETIEKTLFDRSGGKIRVSRSGITGAHQSVAGMFKGKGGGNFRFKAALESSHNLIHNELAMLPGQTGMDVARRPEELSGMLKYSDDLMKAAALLPPQRRALLQFPLHDYFSHFLPLLGDVYDVINRRGEDPDRFDHDLEGWEALGHTVVEYRLSAAAQQWIGPGEFLKLPEPERQALARFAQAAPEMYARTRKLSPREVWTANRQRLRPVPAFVISEILGEDLGREVRTGNGYFEFSDADISAEPLLFEARVTDEQGRQCELRDREKYLVFCNPFAADQLFVHDARLGHIGVAQRVKRVSRLDPKALAEAAKRAAERTNDLLVDVRKRHTAMTRERTEMLNHNADVIEGRTMTPTERATLDESDRLKKAYDTLLETSSD